MVVSSVGVIRVPGEGDDEGTQAQERHGGQEGGQGSQLERLRQEVRQEAGGDGQEPVVVGGKREGTVEPGWGEPVDVKMLVDVPRLKGGAEEGGGQTSQHSPSKQHQEVTPDLREGGI